MSNNTQYAQQLRTPTVRILDFEQTCDLCARMRTHRRDRAPDRYRIGALEYIDGTVIDDRTRETIRTTVCIDPVTGGSIVTQCWLAGWPRESR